MTEDDIFLPAKRLFEDWDAMPALEETTCRTCRTPGVRPPHMPSLNCEHGGTTTHCTCQRCWGR